MRRHANRLLSSAMGLAALAATSLPAAAGDVVMFTDRVPGAAELAGLLWPSPPSATPEGMRTRSLAQRTRAIRLHAPPPAPAAPAPGTQQVAAAEPVVQSDAVVAAVPAPEGSGFGFNIRFAFDSAQIMPESRPFLNEVGAMLKSPEAQGQAVAIVGHTDATGPADYNVHLSQRRAAAVAEYLIKQHGIAADRLRVSGLGEEQPLRGESPVSGANRRVEFHPAG